jgi:lanosterol synthase
VVHNGRHVLCGTNGGELWNEGFITQALVETVLANDEDNKQGLTEALR